MIMQFEKMIPIYYWPTVIYLVDDDDAFSISSQISLSTAYTVEISIEPSECVKQINMQSNDGYPFEFSKNTEDEENDNIRIVRNDFSKFLEKKDDPNKYKIISVLIMDYNLPKNTGLYYINKIVNPIVQKILLTGYAKPKEIIEAFNRGFIHKYISKDEDNVVDKLFSDIKILQGKYFEIISENLIKQSDEDLFNLLSNKHFIKIFKKLISKNAIKEFYLIDGLGSYLLINDKNQKLIFVCTTQSNIDDLELLFDSEETSVQGLIKEISNYQKIPFFYGKVAEVIAPKDWHSYCFDAHKIPNTEILYSLITDLKNYSF